MLLWNLSGFLILKLQKWKLSKTTWKIYIHNKHFHVTRITLTISKKKHSDHNKKKFTTTNSHESKTKRRFVLYNIKLMHFARNMLQ